MAVAISMREAVIVASSRTPLAKSFRGSFNLTRPDDLAAHCIQNLLRKVPQLDRAEIEEVVLGCGQPFGQQGNNVARVALIRAGWNSHHSRNASRGAPASTDAKRQQPIAVPLR